MRDMQRFGTRDLAALGLLLAVVCLLFAPALAQPDRLLFGKDLYGEWFNYESYIRHALSQGHLPLWNPYNSSGTPVLADPQMGLLYPPNVLLRGLPLNTFFVVAYVLHFWLAAAGVYLLCRQLALSRGACLVGALGVALSTPLTQLIYPGHITVIYSLSWTPMIMALATRSVQRGGWLPHPGLVLALVMQFMAGFPQISVYTLGCVALYYGYSVLWPPGRGSRRRGRLEPLFELTLVALLFLGVGALQIFPTLRLVGEAGRSAGLSWDYATKGSFPAAQLGTILFPLAFDDARNGYVPYVGWLLLTMAPLAFVSRQRRRIVVFLALLGTGALALASARDLPLFALVHGILPIFRIPSRSLFIWCLCTGVLGAIGFDVIHGHGDSRALRNRKTVAYLLSLALVLTFLAALGLRTDAVDAEVLGGGPRVLGTAVWILALQAVGFATLGACVLSRRAQALMVVAAVGMVWIDLYSLSRPLVTVDRPVLYETVSEALDGLEVGRVIDLCPDIIPANRFMVMRVPVTDGYNSLFLADYARFLGLVNGGGPDEPVESWGLLNGRGQMPPRLDLLRMLNVTHVLSCEPTMDRRLVLEREVESSRNRSASYVYRLRDPLPRAVMTCGDTVWASREQTAELLANGLGEPADPRIGPAVSATGFSAIINPRSCTENGVEAVARVLSRDDPSGELVLNVIAPKRGFLYISEVYYPERKVWVDGVQGKLRRANLAFSGVEIAAGRHRVRIRYVPQSWYLGLAVSCLTLVSWAGFAAAVRRLGPLRDSTGSQLDLLEPLGPRVGIHGKSSGFRKMMRSLRIQRAQMAKGALIAMSCGLLAFAGGLALLPDRRIHVRWIPGISVVERGESEQRLGLGRGRLVDGRTWDYGIQEPTEEDLRALVRDEIVEDTHGFDRETFELPPSDLVQRALPIGIWTAIVAGIALILRWAANRRR